MKQAMAVEQPKADEFWTSRTEFGDRLAKISALMFRAQFAGIWMQDRDAENDVLIGSFNIPAGTDMGGFRTPKVFDDIYLYNVTPEILPDHPLVNGTIGDVRTVVFVPINLGNHVHWLRRRMFILDHHADFPAKVLDRLCRRIVR